MFNLARGLVSDGHQVTVITHDRSPAESPGVNIVMVPVKDVPSTFLIRLQKWRMEPFHTWATDAYNAYRALLKSGYQYDVIESAEYGAWARNFSRGSVPLVIRCHNPSLIVRQLNASSRLSVWLIIQNYRERKQALTADAIVCPSHALSNWIKDNWGVRKVDISVIPNLIDDNLFSTGSIGNGKKVEVVYVGRLEEKKGVFDFAEAVAPLLDVYQNLVVRFIGLDIAVDEIISENKVMASEYILGKVSGDARRRVFFSGHIPVTCIIEYWRNALCAVVPSRMLESFSYTTVEAMACGCPVIASRRGGPAEIITEGHDGVLFEPGNVVELRAAIDKLIGNEKLRQSLSLNARRTVVDQYGVSVVTKSITDHYQQVIRKRGFSAINSW
jgi:glycosyltransferase involved in cell wall biosynthesis